MFNVGDKVRRIDGRQGNMRTGDVATVKEILNSEWMLLHEFEEEHLIDRFELVEEHVAELPEEEKIKRVIDGLTEIQEATPMERIKELEYDIKAYENDIKRYREYMNNTWKRYKDAMSKVEILKACKPKPIIEDIKALKEHKYVSDVFFKRVNKELIIITDYIDIFDEDDNKFKGNKYELTFNFNAMTCYIKGLDEDYNRESYWSDHDPHPHVSGNTGEACWGNAGSMLTDSMNEFEIFASFIVVLNFLQQVNTSDAAGKYVRNWDCIDEDGNELDNPHSIETEICCVCDDEIERSDAFYCEDCQEHMCERHSVYIDYGDKYVCEGCYDGNYTYCDDCGDKISYDDEEYREFADTSYCSCCFSKEHIECCECDEPILKENGTQIDGSYYCDDCYDSYFIMCDECGETVRKEDIFYCNDCGNTYCNSCKDETIPGLCQDCDERQREEEEEEELAENC